MREFIDPPQQADEDSGDNYRSYGRFDPFDAERILKRFTELGVRFQIADASGVIWTGVALYNPPVQLGRANLIEIFVHREDDQKAGKILSDN